MFLAGLVFLNQLYTERNSIILDGHIEHLKTVFMILSAMRGFYAPAHLWVETLFQVHALDHLPELSVIVNEGFFAQFSARLGGIREPPYCPLEPGQMHAATIPISFEHNVEYTSPGSLGSSLEQEYQIEAQHGADDSSSSESVSGDEISWFQEYRQQIGLGS